MEDGIFYGWIKGRLWLEIDEVGWKLNILGHHL